MEKNFTTLDMRNAVEAALTFAAHSSELFDISWTRGDKYAAEIARKQEDDPIFGGHGNWVGINGKGDAIRILLTNGQIFEIEMHQLGNVDDPYSAEAAGQLNFDDRSNSSESRQPTKRES